MGTLGIFLVIKWVFSSSRYRYFIPESCKFIWYFKVGNSQIIHRYRSLCKDSLDATSDATFASFASTPDYFGDLHFTCPIHDTHFHLRLTIVFPGSTLQTGRTCNGTRVCRLRKKYLCHA